MKILAINLLRLGDILATAPALRALRRRHPTAKIELMINANFRAVANLLGDVDSVRLFERDQLQRGCVEAETPMFAAYDVLQEFMDELASQRYDLIVNFTHNRLSGWIAGLIPAKEKVGLVMDGSGGVSFGSHWFRQLNQQADLDDESAFNHSDVFFGAVGGFPLLEEDGGARMLDGLLQESELGRSEAKRILEATEGPKNGRRIALQITTSDSKKEWGFENFGAMIRTIDRELGPNTYYVLGAPAERERIEEFCQTYSRSSDSKQAGRTIVPALIGLQGALSLLEEVDILITGDTAVKHLAAAASVPTVELILGSGDAFRTGSWKTGDVVLRSREACAPCGHSELCHRTSHACAESLNPALVAAIVRGKLTGAYRKDLCEIAASFADTAEVLVVDRKELTCLPLPLGGAVTDFRVGERVDRAARRIAIETRDRRFQSMMFGGEIRRLRQSLELEFPETTSEEFRHIASEGERRLRHAEGIVQSLGLQLARLREAYEDPKRMREVVMSVISLRTRLAKNQTMRFMAEALLPIAEDDRSPAFSRFRKLHDAVADLQMRISISLKLLRGLETEFESDVYPEPSEGSI